MAWPGEDVERGLQALAEYGSSIKAAEATGIPESTLRTWRLQRSDEFDEIRREKRGTFIEEAWQVAHEALAELRKMLTSMKGKELAVAYGILVDKALLMGGEATDIKKLDIEAETRELVWGDATPGLEAARESAKGRGG